MAGSVELVGAMAHSPEGVEMWFGLLKVQDPGCVDVVAELSLKEGSLVDEGIDPSIEEVSFRWPSWQLVGP